VRSTAGSAIVVVGSASAEPPPEVVVQRIPVPGREIVLLVPLWPNPKVRPRNGGTESDELFVPRFQYIPGRILMRLRKMNAIDLSVFAYLK
jgi:hypothetical protein